MPLILKSLLIAIFTANAYGFGVDLHAHLFMEKGVKVIYRGNFFSPYIKARNWKDSRKSQVNEKLLAQSDLSIVVASLYAAPILAGKSMYGSILMQIKMAEKFIERNPNWIIAKSSSEARAALAQGKKIIVLSIEGADYFVNSLKQLKDLYQRGVRIITLLHLTRDRIGAPAFLKWSDAIFSTPGAYWACYNRDRNYVKINCSGLTDHGEQVAKMLVDAGIWIDLTHASDRALEYLIDLHYQKNIPLLYTHGTLRTRMKAERSASEEFLSHYKKLGGIFGLMPSRKYLGKVHRYKKCRGTIEDYKDHYDHLLNFLQPDQITIGSDTNGMIEHMKPRYKNRFCRFKYGVTEFDKNGGWWNFSHSIPLYQELVNMDSQMATSKQIIERFLTEWSRIEQAATNENIWSENSPYRHLRR